MMRSGCLRQSEICFVSAGCLPHCSSFARTTTPCKRRSQWRAIPRKRVRLRAMPRCATGNKGWDDFQSKASDSLQTAGRFFQTSTGQAVLWGGLIWLVLTGRIGWIFDSFLYLLLFFSVVPIVGVLALRWWLNRQLVQGTCPSCGSKVTGLKNQPFQCMNCGQVVRGENREDFSVNDPSSATIDIDAKRVD